MININNEVISVNLSNILYSICFILTDVALFILNNDRSNSNLTILNAILALFTAILLSIILIRIRNPFKINKTALIFAGGCIISAICTLIFRNYISLHWIYLIVCIYIVFSKEQLSYKLIKYSICISTISIIVQLCIFKSPDGRHVLSYIDPNYSGYCIFSLFLFSWYNGFKRIAYILLISGFVLLSRGYILSVIVFFVVYKLPFIQTVLKRFNYTALFLLSYVLLLLYSLYFVYRYEDNVVNQTFGEKDVTEFADQSNLHRFTANLLFVEDIVDHPSKYYWGVDLKEYTRTVFINSPHNSLFQLVLNYGLFFSFFYICLFTFILSRFKSSDNFIPAYLSLLIYFLFLGGGIFGIQVIWWGFVYKASVSNNDKRLKLQ